MDKKSMFEKFLTALLIATLAGITFIVLPLAFSRGGSDHSLSLYSWFFSWAGTIVLLGFAIVGYFATDKKIESIFSLLWGTHAIYNNRWFQVLMVASITMLIIKFNF